MEDSIINIAVPSREVLIQEIDKKLGKPLKNSDPRKFIYLSIVRDDCGCVYNYKTKKDVPKEDVTCEHDNKLIVYTDK